LVSTADDRWSAMLCDSPADRIQCLSPNQVREQLSRFGSPDLMAQAFDINSWRALENNFMAMDFAHHYFPIIPSKRPPTPGAGGSSKKAKKNGPN